jgi:hypothetical protein
LADRAAGDEVAHDAGDATAPKHRRRARVSVAHAGVDLADSRHGNDTRRPVQVPEDARRVDHRKRHYVEPAGVNPLQASLPHAAEMNRRTALLVPVFVTAQSVVGSMYLPRTASVSLTATLQGNTRPRDAALRRGRAPRPRCDDSARCDAAVKAGQAQTGPRMLCDRRLQLRAGAAFGSLPRVEA